MENGLFSCYFLVFCLFFRVIFVQQGRRFSFLKKKPSHELQNGHIILLVLQILTTRQIEKNNEEIKPRVSLQAWMFPPFCFSRGITLQAHRVAALLLPSPRTVSPTSMSVSSMFNKSNLRTRAALRFFFFFFAFPVFFLSRQTPINENNGSDSTASSRTRTGRRRNQCSPLQHIRGVPASVALKVPIYKVIGLRVFNSGARSWFETPSAAKRMDGCWLEEGWQQWADARRRGVEGWVLVVCVLEWEGVTACRQSATQTLCCCH